MLCFKKSYFALTFLLLLIEILIAIFAEGVLRTFIGDMLIVIFLYTFVLSFFKFNRLKTAFGILLLAYTTEFIQSLKLLDYFNLSHSKAMILLLGHRFDWWDMVAYTLGISMVLMAEHILNSKKLNA